MIKDKKTSKQTAGALMFKEIIGFPGYYVRSDGKVFKNSATGCATFDKEITPHRVNRHDKQLSVFLFKDGKKKAVPLRYIILNAFYGEREKKCYKAEFIDGDSNNCSFKNLRWMLRKNLSFFDILDDKEFKLFDAAIREIKYINEIRKRNDIWMQKIASWMRKNQTATADERYEFFKNLFKA